MDSKEVLKEYFGYDSFRAGQEDIINAILEKKDVLAIMPTGAGKSLCYQVPAMMLSGITVVISPLISLMQDQVKSLNDVGINAAYVNSTLSESEIDGTLNMVLNGIYKIIYIAPERLESAKFCEFSKQADISMVTVDEAHCISQWGQDFRPSYVKIVDYINSLPARPVVSAFTATATNEVKTDIECILRLDNPKVVITGFDRKNLYYSVEHISGKNRDRYISNYVKEHIDESDKTELSKQAVPLLKNPRILAGMIESQKKYFTPALRELIEEGKNDGSIKTEYAKEISEIIPLLEIWLMPSVFPANEEEFHHKFVFIKKICEFVGVPIFNEQISNMIDDWYEKTEK